jgi:hypothetical protein
MHKYKIHFKEEMDLENCASCASWWQKTAIVLVHTL